MKINLSISILILILILLSGCCGPKAPENWTGTARILPIIVSNTKGESRWSVDRIVNGFSKANQYWEKTGVQFKISAPEVIKDDRIYDQSGLLDFTNITLKSHRIAKSRNIYPVYFVNSIKWGDKPYGGMSTMADAPLGFQYGTIISSVVGNRTGYVISHELGHAWNIRHTWQDKHTDTPSIGPTDCNPLIKCNVLAYCWPQIDCPPPEFFTKEQIQEIRNWSFGNSRAHLFEELKNMAQIVLPLQDNFDPIKDPFE